MPSTAPVGPVRPATRPLARPRAAGAVVASLSVAVAASVGVWLLWRVFVVTYTGQRVDQVALEGAEYGQGRLWRVAEPLLDVVSIPFMALVLLAAVLIATIRRRWGLAVQVAVLMGGANLSTQVLKRGVMDRDDLGFGPNPANTLPSGHTTAAASVSAALLFVVPPRLRPWAAVVGAGYTSATGVSTMVGQWHRPSDVAAAVLVVLAWSALACALTAASRWSGGSRAASGGRALTSSSPSSTGALALLDDAGRGAVRVVSGLLALAGLAAALPATVALLRIWAAPDAPATSTELLTGYVGGALGVVAVVCLAFAVLLTVRDLAGRTGGRAV